MSSERSSKYDQGEAAAAFEPLYEDAVNRFWSGQGEPGPHGRYGSYRAIEDAVRSRLAGASREELIDLIVGAVDANIAVPSPVREFLPEHLDTWEHLAQIVLTPTLVALMASRDPRTMYEEERRSDAADGRVWTQDAQPDPSEFGLPPEAALPYVPPGEQ